VTQVLTTDGNVLRYPQEVVRWLKGIKHPAYYWEVSHNRKEMAVIPTKALRERADPKPFREHFERSDRKHPQSTCVSFQSLGGSAWLVCPKPMPGVDINVYAHLATFVADAPEEQVDELFKLVGLRAAAFPDYYVSTSGLGVSWLHVRIEPTAKYYKHQPFIAN
jgi:hypothetical protein